MKSAIESIKTINNINTNNTNNSIKNDKLKFTNTLKIKVRNLEFDKLTNVETTNSKLESLEYSNKLISLDDFSYSQEFSELVNNINNYTDTVTYKGNQIYGISIGTIPDDKLNFIIYNYNFGVLKIGQKNGKIWV
jgi:hypothetical protein